MTPVGKSRRSAMILLSVSKTYEMGEGRSRLDLWIFKSTGVSRYRGRSDTAIGSDEHPRKAARRTRRSLTCSAAWCRGFVRQSASLHPQRMGFVFQSLSAGQAHARNVRSCR